MPPAPQPSHPEIEPESGDDCLAESPVDCARQVRHLTVLVGREPSAVRGRAGSGLLGAVTTLTLKVGELVSAYEDDRRERQARAEAWRRRLTIAAAVVPALGVLAAGGAWLFSHLHIVR